MDRITPQSLLMHRCIQCGFAFGLVAAIAGLAAPTVVAAATFSNPASIAINDGTCNTQGVGSAQAAAPYPSQITVSGLGTVTAVKVTLTGLTHTFPDDVGVLLVGPGGQHTILMADTGGQTDVSAVTLTFDDAAAASLPDEGTLTSGTYQPTVGESTSGTSCLVPASFPAPAPAGPYGSTLSVFNGTDPNGLWSLYVIDDSALDAGSIAGGWSLDITAEAASEPAEAIADLQAQVAGLGLPKGLTTALNSTLNAALAALDADDTDGTCDTLEAFLHQVAAQNGKKLTEAQAQQLTDSANEILALLDC